jgi:hypothetical protein
LAGLTKEILGPYKIIGHFCEEINGPIQMLWQDSLKTSWAHILARLTEDILGPYEIINHFYGEINGPTQMLQQDSPKKS